MVMRKSLGPLNQTEADSDIPISLYMCGFLIELRWMFDRRQGYSFAASHGDIFLLKNAKR